MASAILTAVEAPVSTEMIKIGEQPEE